MFKKDDSKKIRLELIDPTFINGLGAVLTFGAEKYEANNWKKAHTVADRERIKGAMLRHQMCLGRGETIDQESGLHHAYHIACNAMFLAYHDMHSGRIHKDQSIMVFDDDGAPE